ncbi:biotin--[acetyl-CoA-carboxylase] ligase [Altericista sp. CCNU0014]|uniref:biotin--[acetyl-CoA-carboxylase] ligase n=1 Tax=Altericista sp. CCNU0014 TaxID=3082949 RepID=UPI0038501418
MDLSENPVPEWLHWLETCPSTNTWAIANAPQLHHGDVVFTQYQTAGRGQQGRIWHSPPGVLTASFVLDRIPAAQLPALSLAAGLAAIYAIEDLAADCQGHLHLKWPNDVLAQGRKLAGILCEASSMEATGRVVVGIGLNRCGGQQGALAAIAPQSVSLDLLSSIVPSELDLLKRLRHYLRQTAGLLQFKENRSGSGLNDLLPALRARDALLGQSITVDVGSEKFTGEGAGIGDRGQFLLRLSNGEVKAFASGHITLT